MTIAIPLATAHARVRHVLVSVPRIECLLGDPGSRWFVIPTLDTAPAPTPQQPAPARMRRHRGPRYQTLLKDWAEARGDRDAFARILRKRLTRAGVVRARPRHDAELEADLDRMFGRIRQTPIGA